MTRSSDSLISSSLLFELGRAYRSMLDLDMVIPAVFKQALTGINGTGISIWLLNEAGTELECTHALGVQAAKMLGISTNARKFISTHRPQIVKKIQVNDVSLSMWMPAGMIHEHFNMDARNVIVVSLMARGELLGALIATRQAGTDAFSSQERGLLHQLSAQIATAIQNTQLYERQNQTSEHQKLLNQISNHLHQTLDIDTLIPRIFAEVNKAIHAEAQSIWLVDEEACTIKCHFTTGPEAWIIEGLTISLDTPSIVGTSVLKKKSIIIKDAQKDPRRARSVDEKTGFTTHSLMTVPLVLKDRSIGAIQAVNKQGGKFFNQDDLDLFRSIADSAVLAVNNAQLMADLQNSYDMTLEALSSALDLRDRETEGHSRRVVEYTARLAEQVGLGKQSINEIRRGALIHDIGKIGVPDAVLNKPDSLSKEERKVMERHPRVGHFILTGIPYLAEEIKIVVYHHEKWDGTGYPFGLRGEQIPLGARLFAIADTFDALTSDRPYRKGRPYQIAREVIEKESGKQFDPQGVAAFLAIPADEWDLLRERVIGEVIQQRSHKDELYLKRSV
ncbi:MAG: GAF domain-containing protein [Chloroflexi bacterium]|nr:GAF domain-containing protein [Chloroflexota bacterium]